MGVGRFVLLEPNVQRVTVAIDPPTLEDARSHVRRLLDALEGLDDVQDVYTTAVLD
jgi:transcriptional/translational regulatory protein YebC/TACO1